MAGRTRNCPITRERGFIKQPLRGTDIFEHNAFRQDLELRFLVVEKWDDADAQREHLNSEAMITMATQASKLLTGPPDLELYDVISAHDLE